MKKSVAIIMAAFMAASLVACTSESTSETNINVTTTTDEGTKEYNYTEETKNGETTTTETVTETPAEGTQDENEPDVDEDNITYRVETGYLYVEAPSKSDYWLEVEQYENTTKLSTWEVDGETYKATVAANIDSGSGYVILGAYDDPDELPYEHFIIPVNIENHEITGAADAIPVEGLEEYFPVFENAFKAVNDKGEDVLVLAFYSDLDSDYAWLYDGKSGDYVDYVASLGTFTDDDGNKYDSTKITIGELVVEYFKAGDDYYIIVGGKPYAMADITEDEVLALQQ